MKAVAIITRILMVLFTAAVVILVGVLTLPKLFGYVPYVVTSGSMEPSINTGAVAFVNTHDTEAFTGEVVAFTTGDGAVVLHRLVEYDSETDTYTTKGDANDVEDQLPLEKEAIIGTYTMQVPRLGYFVAKLESRNFRIGNVTIPAAAAIIVGAIAFLYIADSFFSSLLQKKDD